jgi:hypothetical protein
MLELSTPTVWELGVCPEGVVWSGVDDGFATERVWRTGAVSGMKGWLAFGACRKPSINS